MILILQFATRVYFDERGFLSLCLSLSEGNFFDPIDEGGGNEGDNVAGEG